MPVHAAAGLRSAESNKARVCAAAWQTAQQVAAPGRAAAVNILQAEGAIGVRDNTPLTGVAGLADGAAIHAGVRAL